MSLLLEALKKASEEKDEKKSSLERTKQLLDDLEKDDLHEEADNNFDEDGNQDEDDNPIGDHSLEQENSNPTEIDADQAKELADELDLFIEDDSDLSHNFTPSDEVPDLDLSLDTDNGIDLDDFEPPAESANHPTENPIKMALKRELETTVQHETPTQEPPTLHTNDYVLAPNTTSNDASETSEENHFEQTELSLTESDSEQWNASEWEMPDEEQESFAETDSEMTQIDLNQQHALALDEYDNDPTDLQLDEGLDERLDETQFDETEAPTELLIEEDTYNTDDFDHNEEPVNNTDQQALSQEGDATDTRQAEHASMVNAIAAKNRKIKKERSLKSMIAIAGVFTVSTIAGLFYYQYYTVSQNTMVVTPPLDNSDTVYEQIPDDLLQPELQQNNAATIAAVDKANLAEPITSPSTAPTNSNEQALASGQTLSQQPTDSGQQAAAEIPASRDDTTDDTLVDTAQSISQQPNANDTTIESAALPETGAQTPSPDESVASMAPETFPSASTDAADGNRSTEENNPDTNTPEAIPASSNNQLATTGYTEKPEPPKQNEPAGSDSNIDSVASRDTVTKPLPTSDSQNNPIETTQTADKTADNQRSVAQNDQPSGTGSDDQKSSSSIAAMEPKNNSDTLNSMLDRRQQRSNLEALLLSGYRGLQSGRTLDAQDLYKQALRYDPTNRDAKLGLAATYAQNNDWQSALTLYEELLTVNPQDSLAKAGVLRIRQNIDPRQMETQLKILLSESQDPSPMVLATLGDLYSQQEKWSEAHKAFYNAWVKIPNDPNLAFNVAVSLEHLNRYQSALRYYRIALENSLYRQPQFSRQTVTVRVGELEQHFSRITR